MSKEDREDILAARAADAMARVASAAKGKDMSEWEDESGSRISQTTKCHRCGGAGRLRIDEPESNGGQISAVCDRCGGSGRTSSTTDECAPPDGTDDFTMHYLSREVGDGSRRQEFEALWTGGLWQTKGMQQLSPRKAAYATWQYVRQNPDV